jgi:hypothetical protein
VRILLIFVSITLLLVAPLSRFNSSRVYADSSSYPKPAHLGTPVLTNMPLQINVLLLGVPQNLVDEQRVQSQLEKWYTQIDRARYVATGKMEMYANFSLKYNFVFVTPTLANAYAQFLSNRHLEDLSPPGLRQYTPSAWYVNAYLAESWLRNNLTIPSEGYTLIVIDTSHTSPSISNYYFYDGTLPDPDTHLTPKQFTSSYMIGYGGDAPNRFLFLDLNAGPTCYFIPINCPNDADVRPINAYDFAHSSDVGAFNDDLGRYIRNAVDLRFVPSPLYRPVYRDSFYLNVTIFSGDPTIQYSNYLNMTHVLTVFHALIPLSNFTGGVHEVPIQKDPGLYATVQSATNGDGRLNGSKVESYFLQNYGHYVAASGTTKVLPIFILGGYLFSQFFGEAASTSDGNFGFVMEGINQTILARGDGLTYVSIHETSHALGLPHPHDGFDWTLYRNGIGIPAGNLPGELVFWAYDYSGSMTTYAIDNIFPDQMNYDARDIGTTTVLLNATYANLDSTKRTLDTTGVAPNRTITQDAQIALDYSKDAVGNFSLPNPDYFKAAVDARLALNASAWAYLDAIQLSSTTTSTSTTVPDFNSLSLMFIVILTLSFAAAFLKKYPRR